MSTFVALDFETADRSPDSACALGLVRVERGHITHRIERLIRPPRRHFVFTDIHHITWDHVAAAPRFSEVWRSVVPFLDGAEFLAAHNARFDRGVLHACCAAAGLAPPALGFQCTMKLAREQWGIRRVALPDVCAHLGLTLRHHNALSDAEACAGIMLAAGR